MVRLHPNKYAINFEEQSFLIFLIFWVNKRNIQIIASLVYCTLLSNALLYQIDIPILVPFL